MKTPSEFEINKLLAHYAEAYDPAKAHEYYMRTRKLKGRKKGRTEQPKGRTHGGRGRDPRTGKTREQIHKEAVAEQRRLFHKYIGDLERKLHKLEALIHKKEQEAKAENRKAKAKKERAQKEKDKPKTAAEKAKVARENKQYREKHQQKLRGQTKTESTSTSSKTKTDSGPSISELKALATRVRGKIAIAKQKLAALS